MQDTPIVVILHFARLAFQAPLCFLTSRTIHSETISETTPKDEKVRHRDEQCEPANSVENKSFVRIQHVQSGPQIEAVHTFADESISSTQSVGVGIC